MHEPETLSAVPHSGQRPVVNPSGSPGALPAAAVAPARPAPQLLSIPPAERLWVKPLSYEVSKRVIDFVVAGLALALLSPVMLIAAALVKIWDFGPVLFVQVRVGRNGQQFCCYKFRSMIPEADSMKEDVQKLNHHAEGITFKSPYDPRMTFIGWILRKTSIDELPQLINVVKGDMSLVGPRPPIPAEVMQYTPDQLRRLLVRPGLTCIWQVSGRGDVPFSQQVRMDLEYIEKRSLWLDIKLLLLTIPVVLTTRGAY